MAGQAGAKEQAALSAGEGHVSASRHRLIRKLRDALGEAICRALDDTSVVEIMVNPDGRLFVERLGQGMEMLAALRARRGRNHHRQRCPRPAERGRRQTGRSSLASLPIGGHRFEGLLPPIVAAPSFTIRRRASRLIPLDDYVREGIMTPVQAGAIRDAIVARLNIVICGGTGSGKTTLANAVIAEIVSVRATGSDGDPRRHGRDPVRRRERRGAPHLRRCRHGDGCSRARCA
jgi:Flp pilus assembly CpaF family ATPase